MLPNIDINSFAVIDDLLFAKDKNHTQEHLFTLDITRSDAYDQKYNY